MTAAPLLTAALAAAALATSANAASCGCKSSPHAVHHRHVAVRTVVIERPVYAGGYADYDRFSGPVQVAPPPPEPAYDVGVLEEGYGVYGGRGGYGERAYDRRDYGHRFARRQEYGRGGYDRRVFEGRGGERFGYRYERR